MFGYSVTTVLLGAVICCQATDDTTQLPEPIESIDTSSYACYGCNSQWQASCEKKPNTVISVQAIKIGAKPKELGCPITVIKGHEEECHNRTCCFPDATNDCIGNYDYTNSEIDYRFHKTCSGKPKCDRTIEIVRDWNACDDHKVNSSDKTYMEYTNYFYMEHACVKKSNMFDMCLNATHQSSNKTLYLHTPKYPNNASIDLHINCSCTLSTVGDYQLEAYLIDVQLSSLEMFIHNGTNGTDGIDSFDESSETKYNITIFDIVNGSSISLKNISSALTSDAKVWLGIKAKTGGDFTISCWGPSVEEEDIKSSPKPPTKSPGGISLEIIIGIIVGGLAFLIVICCLYHFFKKEKKKERKVHPRSGIVRRQNRENINQEMVQSNSNVTEPKPLPKPLPKQLPTKNKTFQSDAIPKNNKVPPTPFIEEHGGLSLHVAGALPPISGAVAPAATGISMGGSTSSRLKPIEPVRPSVENEENTAQKPKKKKKKKKKKRRHRELEEAEANDKRDMMNVWVENDEEETKAYSKKVTKNIEVENDEEETKAYSKKVTKNIEFENDEEETKAYSKKVTINIEVESDDEESGTYCKKAMVNVEVENDVEEDEGIDV
ncbi:hypothetical protein ACF0H5_007300 [Mactra antiquata]